MHGMNPSTPDKLEEILSRGHPDQVVDLLQRVDPAVAADLFMSLPFDGQRSLFRALPIGLAAALSGHFPYYHAYVLLHTRPLEELRAIVSRMQPDLLIQLLDELPEEAWQQLTEEIAAKAPAEAGAAGMIEVEPVPAVAPPLAPPKPIIEAQQIEKRFMQPDGREIQVIAPIDLAVEPGTIIALLGPSGCGKSTLLRILTGLTSPSAGKILWHGATLADCAPNLAIVFQSFTSKLRCWREACRIWNGAGAPCAPSMP